MGGTTAKLATLPTARLHCYVPKRQCAQLVRLLQLPVMLALQKGLSVEQL